MSLLYLAGIGASIISLSGITFQLVRIIQIKDATAHSYNGLILISTSLFLWIIFGISLNDPVIFWVNMIAFVEFVCKIVLKYYFQKLKSRTT